MSLFSWFKSMISQNPQVFQNHDKPPRHVFFYFLEPFDNVSNFRCECPECGDGVLTMQRDQSTGELMDVDCCSFCGQHFIFDDIEFVRKAGGW